jgi:3-hydroxymyristoyl/3-hydroxydecanoyl-(acyl carrier protein) dehydratase
VARESQTSLATPHAFPFRLVERSETVGERQVVIVLSTAAGFLRRNEPWPVTLVAEVLAQAILLLDPPERLERARLAALQNVSLLQEVVAGDRLLVEVEPLGSLGGLRRYRCRATRGGASVALADVTVTS